MKAVIFRGSPRAHGNTAALTDVVFDTLQQSGEEVREFSLYEMDIRPCLACRACQKDWSTVSCVQQDDMSRIFEAVTESDRMILSTPIYSWYCTPPMKSMLDRLVYAMNMYYGEKRGPSLWAGKRMALIATCGYPPEKGADLFEEGMRRYCRHSRLVYEGMLCERHLGYHIPFMDEEKKAHAEAFVRGLIQNGLTGKLVNEA